MESRFGFQYRWLRSWGFVLGDATMGHATARIKPTNQQWDPLAGKGQECDGANGINSRVFTMKQLTVLPS